MSSENSVMTKDTPWSNVALMLVYFRVRQPWLTLTCSTIGCISIQPCQVYIFDYSNFTLSIMSSNSSKWLLDFAYNNHMALNPIVIAMHTPTIHPTIYIASGPLMIVSQVGSISAPNLSISSVYHILDTIKALTIAASNVVYTINRCPTPILQYQIPYELLHDTTPN